MISRSSTSPPGVNQVDGLPHVLNEKRSPRVVLLACVGWVYSRLNLAGWCSGYAKHSFRSAPAHS